MEIDNLKMKKIKAISHFGYTTDVESEQILKMFEGDVFKSVEYANSAAYIKNSFNHKKLDVEKLMSTLTPVVENMLEKYTSEEIDSFYISMKEKNKIEEKQFIQRLVVRYMDSLDCLEKKGESF